jgi:Protein of unknown function (DUF3768)
MSTPYDTDEELLVENDTSLKIRALNDEFRTQTSLIGSTIADGTLVITSGVAAHGNDFFDRAVHAVREYSAFTEDNDPYGEHDFGSFEIDGENLFWKIDYYDRLLEWGSPDPADASVTRRVLTILLAEEY